MDDGKLKMKKIGLSDEYAPRPPRVAWQTSLCLMTMHKDLLQGEQGCAPVSQIIIGNCMNLLDDNCQTGATNARGHVLSMQLYFGCIVYGIWNHDIAPKQSNRWMCFVILLFRMSIKYDLGNPVLIFHSWHQSRPSKKACSPRFCLGRQTSVAQTTNNPGWIYATWLRNSSFGFLHIYMATFFMIHHSDI